MPCKRHILEAEICSETGQISEFRAEKSRFKNEVGQFNFRFYVVFRSTCLKLGANSHADWVVESRSAPIFFCKS